MHNLGRLAQALRELDARIRVDDWDESLPFDSSAESLRGISMLNLRTAAGDLDLTFTPSAFPDGYNDLVRDAQPHTIGDITVNVAAIDDVIASKKAAGRPKDIDALPELFGIARRNRRRGQDRDEGIGLCP